MAQTSLDAPEIRHAHLQKGQPMRATTTPRIYIACLASYNAGILHGKWFDIDDYSDVEELQGAINEMLAESPEPDAEEYAIHDWEGFGGYNVEEYDSISDLFTIGELIGKHGTIIADFLGHYMCDLSELAEKFYEAYCGCYKDEEEYASELFDELYAHDIPDNVKFYIDYALFTRDLFTSDCFSISDDDGCHVFYNI